MIDDSVNQIVSALTRPLYILGFYVLLALGLLIAIRRWIPTILATPVAFGAVGIVFYAFYKTYF